MLGSALAHLPSPSAWLEQAHNQLNSPKLLGRFAGSGFTMWSMLALALEKSALEPLLILSNKKTSPQAKQEAGLHSLLQAGVGVVSQLFLAAWAMPRLAYSAAKKALPELGLALKEVPYKAFTTLLNANRLARVEASSLEAGERLAFLVEKAKALPHQVPEQVMALADHSKIMGETVGTFLALGLVMPCISQFLYKQLTARSSKTGQAAPQDEFALNPQPANLEKNNLQQGSQQLRFITTPSYIAAAPPPPPAWVMPPPPLLQSFPLQPTPLQPLPPQTFSGKPFPTSLSV